MEANRKNIKELIIRNLFDKSDHVHQQKADDLVDFIKNNEKILEICDLIEIESSIDTKKEAKKFFDRIEKEEGAKVKALNPRVKPLYKIAIGIAASFLIVSFGWYFFIKGTKTEISNLQNINLEYTLPDGSHVTINKNSTITFHQPLLTKDRKVSLNGEAWFDVKKGAKPFIVTAGNIEVTVLGTKFNIKAYPAGKEVVVVVEEGKVCVKKNVKSDTSHNLVKAGEKISIAVENCKIEVDRNEDINYLAWKTKRLSFIETPLDSVFSELENCYHINIEITDSIVDTCRLTSDFDNQPLDAVFEIISDIFGLQIALKDNTYYIHGTPCK